MPNIGLALNRARNRARIKTSFSARIKTSFKSLVLNTDEIIEGACYRNITKKE